MVIRIPYKSGSEVPEPESKQQEKKEGAEKKDNNSGSTIYTVKKQETLYGISKKFNVTVDDILNANPGIEVLKEGMEIKIPKSSSPVKPPVSESPVNKPANQESNPDELVVKTGETLYSISKANGVSVDDLIELNPQLSGGLKAGMVIKLRKSQEKAKLGPKNEVEPVVSVPDTKAACYDSDNLRTTYNVALLLPFALGDTNPVLDAMAESDPTTFENFNYIQFYAGFMLAADSLEKFGLRAKIQVFDADRLNDTLVIRQVLRKPGMDKMNLLVGPMYGSSFNIAARFARKNQIGIINPLSRRENITEANPYVIKAQVSGNGVSEKLISFIMKNYQGANIIAVQNDKKESKAMVEAFTSGVKEAITNHSFTGTMLESVFSTDQIAGVTKKLKPGVKNIVIMFSNNKSAVPNFVSLLNPSAKSHDVILIGMEDWAGMELETEFLVNLNYHQVATDYVDYESDAAKQFITRFRNKYGAVPITSKYAFLGFDIGWYFLTSMMWYGENYIACIPGNRGDGLQYKFDFEVVKPGDGLQNKDVNILKLQDYKMVLVK
jgi:LysM repeat protein/ABC-type branched-subunit amino acid transport system substrate-binding protein